MARDIQIVSRINIAETKGLCPPPTAKSVHPFFWIEDGTNKLPDVIRFSWQPQTGDCYVGVVIRHVFQIPKDERYPFASYLRGFSFPGSRTIALRTYYWPGETYDFFDESHADLHDRVTDGFLAALKPSLPRGVRTFRSVDNHWLRQTNGHISLYW